MCVNNATSYKVGHTRYLHAWSLGAPVVAHVDASISMPEMEDGVNALLGDSPQGIVDNIYSMLVNSELRQKIAFGGVDTFKKYFSAENVTEIILNKLLNKH